MKTEIQKKNCCDFIIKARTLDNAVVSKGINTAIDTYNGILELITYKIFLNFFRDL